MKPFLKTLLLTTTPVLAVSGAFAAAPSGSDGGNSIIPLDDPSTQPATQPSTEPATQPTPPVRRPPGFGGAAGGGIRG